MQRVLRVRSRYACDTRYVAVELSVPCFALEPAIGAIAAGNCGRHQAECLCDAHTSAVIAELIQPLLCASEYVAVVEGGRP